MSSDMAQRITQQQLESYLWGAATLLRGTIDAGDYKQFIFPLLFYKRLCVVRLEEIRSKDGNLSIPLYVAPSETAKIVESSNGTSLATALDRWLTSRKSAAESLRSILPDISSPTLNETLNGLTTCTLFNRSEWKRVRFGDVVENLNETERDPKDTGIERFIGLEHLEPGSLHIRGWGNVADGTTFTRRCRPGQVLFGKRRAYQRKVAVAEFDAVVSGDIYVLAPSNDCLLPELLPFLCMSERFFEFAVETSAGSLSPRTNWSHLAKFEFALPPLDQQRRIAEILWAVDQTVQASSALLAVCCESEMGVFEARVGGNHEGMWPLVPLEEIVSKFIDYRGKSPDKTDTGVPLITAKNVRDGFLVEEPREFIASDEYDSWMRRGIPEKNDLLFTTEAPLGNVARVPTQRFALAQRIICLSPDSTKVHPSFFFWGMRSTSVQGRIRQKATGTTVFGIKQANLRKVLFPLPALSVQREIAELCDSLAGARSEAEGHKARLEALRVTLLNEILA